MRKKGGRKKCVGPVFPQKQTGENKRKANADCRFWWGGHILKSSNKGEGGGVERRIMV